MRTVTLNINGRDYRVEVDERDILIDVIRDKLHLYGTKKGCAAGECGSCSIIMDGDVVNACLIFAFRGEGHRFETIESMAKAGELHPLQKIFMKNGALQCGYCGPGMLISAKALLDKNPHPTEKEVRAGMSGNVCRCTGYSNIIKSVLEYADSLGGEEQ